MSKRSIPFARGRKPFPPDAVTQTFGFLGRKGSGKTYAAGKLVEGMLDIGAQVVVLDPVGNWYGLRVGNEAFDIPVLGGAHGDIPLEHTAGALIADVIADRHTSAVLDLSLFRKAQRKTFVADFAERLFHRKKTLLSPVHMVFEEAQVFAPQRSGRGGERMLGAIEDIVRLGRNYGIGASLISQRPQSVNKEVLNQVECLIVLQINGSHERKAIESWVVHQGLDTKEMVADLPSLPVGTAFMWSPQWLGEFTKIRVLKKRSADTSATPTVSNRRRTAAPKALGKNELADLHKAMADTVERAKKNDPKALRRRIAELEQQLAKASTKTKVVEKSVLTAKDQKRLEAIGAELEKNGRILKENERLLADTTQLLDKLRTLALAHAAAPRRVDEPRQYTPPETTSSPKRPHERAVRAQTNSTPHIRAGALRMLRCLADFYPATMTKRQIAGAAKMKSTGGTFNTYWSVLRRNGLILAGANGRWRITDAGFATLGITSAPQMPGSVDERVDYWRARLRAGAVRMLDIFHERWHNGQATIEKSQLAIEVQMEASGGTFNTYLGVLKNNGLVDHDRDSGLYSLSDWIVRGDV